MIYLMTLEALRLYSLKWRDFQRIMNWEYPPVQLRWDKIFRISAVATPKF
jgi:hypothetical protein